MSKTLIDEVLRPGSLRALFQPIVEVSGEDEEIHAFECLVRGPRGTNLERADVLFEYVRRKMRQREVDRACVRLALAEAGRLPAGARVTLNVHASTLAADDGFFDALADSCTETGIAPSRLVIEIVEFSPGWGGPAFLGALERLRTDGCAIALDDVGNGHSNYRMILDSGPEYLKLDRYFVQGAHADRRRRHVIESARDLADRFDARLVAEGVEDARDLALLRALGVPLVQGFLFAPPLEASAFRGGSVRPPAPAFS